MFLLKRFKNRFFRFQWQGRITFSTCLESVFIILVHSSLIRARHVLKTVKKIYSTNFKDKGSKFFGYLFPCTNEDEFDNELQKLKKEFWDASHHCYGYRIGAKNTIEFSSDDGEPSGTAGLPILNQLRSFGLVDVGAVVIRYFGGTKLGKPGLINAYGYSAEQTIRQAGLKEIIPCVWFELTYNYPEQNLIEKLKLDFELKEAKSDYTEKVTLEVAVASEKAEPFEQQLQKHEYLGIVFEKINSGYYFK